MGEQCLDVQGLGVSSFWGIKETGVEYVIIDLRNNSLRNFEHFGTHPKLVELRLQNNQIESLMGLTRQPSLATLDLDGNPIATHPWYRVMALMVVGFSITTIDGTAVSAKERDIARVFGSAAALAVSYGWKLQPGKRSPEEYRQIIEECKHARKRSLQQQGPSKTIAHVLKKYHGTGGVVLPVPDETSAGISLNAWKLESLSARVRQLENLLCKGTEGLQIQQASWRETVDMGRVEGLTGAELCCARSILFTDGIHLRTNTMTLLHHCGTGPIRGSLMFEGQSLVLLSFISRVRLAEWALSDIKAEYCPPSTLRIERTYGAVFDISFENTLSLWSVYKLMHMRRGVTVPALHLRDEAEANIMLRGDTTEYMALDVDGNGNRSSSTVTGKGGCHEKPGSPQENVGTVTPFLSGLGSLHDDGSSPGDSPSLEDHGMQPVVDPVVSPGENVLRGNSPGEGSINRPAADAATPRKEDHMEGGCSTLEAVHARALSLSRGQPPPPPRAPSRRCSYTSAPSIPRRHPSSTRSSSALKDSNAVDRPTELSGVHLPRIRPFRITASDSDSDSDSLTDGHSKR